MRWFVALLLLLNTACLGTLRREEVRTQALREHYASSGFAKTRESFVRLWEQRDSISFGCLSFDAPCRMPAKQPNEFCFAWGAERACFTVEQKNERLAVVRTDKVLARNIERWLYERLDPDFHATDEAVTDAVEVQVQKEEEPPLDGNSFWLVTRMAIQLPAVSVGLQVQGGYRRWLEHFLLLSVGGYERTVATSADSLMSRDSVLFTARLELSAHSPGIEKRLHLPGIGAYFGLTGVLGVAPVTSWTTRAFIGVSSVVPLSFEFGYAVSSSGLLNPVGNFYVAAGLGI